MKWTHFILRWALVMLLLGSCSGVFAQDAATARAQRVYEQFDEMILIHH